MVFTVGYAYGGNITGNVSVSKSKMSYTFLVYIDKVEGKTFEPTKEIPVMDQKDVEFRPHILPVVAGTTVEFLNSDTQKHNVFGFGDNDDFNLGTWEPGAKETYTFSNPGVITCLCNIHAEMEGFIVVLENPYFALTDESGKYVIKDVPAGSYKLMAWTENMDISENNVTVPDTGDITVDIEMKR